MCFTIRRDATRIDLRRAVEDAAGYLHAEQLLNRWEAVPYMQVCSGLRIRAVGFDVVDIVPDDTRRPEYSKEFGCIKQLQN
jgi:hypothetical protein